MKNGEESQKRGMREGKKECKCVWEKECECVNVCVCVRERERSNANRRVVNSRRKDKLDKKIVARSKFVRKSKISENA